MPLLVIPTNLDFETVQVLEGLARHLAARQAQGRRIIDFSPNEIAAAAARTVTRVESCDVHAWIGTENAAFGHIIELAAVAIETADLIARAAELSAAPLRSFPALDTAARDALREIEDDDLREIRASVSA